MDRKDDMDLESLKNMLSDVPDTDEFDLDSIIAEVSGQAPAKAAEPMPKAAAEPEKPVEPQPAPAAETKAEEPQTTPSTPPFGHSVVPVAVSADPCRSCRVSQLCTEL